MQVKVKNLPRLSLGDLLRRRKMSLGQFLAESGIYAYAALVIKCNEIGVQPPTEEQYHAVVPRTVSSPQDGIVVLEPIPVIDEISGRRIDPEAPVTVPEVIVKIEREEESDDVEPTVGQQKRRKRKKDEQQEA